MDPERIARPLNVIAANVLDEHLLYEAVCFTIVFIVMSLAHVTDVGEGSVSKSASGIAERLECVLRLP